MESMDVRPAISHLTASLAGAAALLIGDLAWLRPSTLHVSWVIATLHLSLGALVGLTMLGGEALIERCDLGPASAAAVRGAESLLVLAPTMGDLFDGPFASTLHGAAWG